MEQQDYYCGASNELCSVIDVILPVYCGAFEIKMCAWQVRVPGFEFIGCGEARSKKEAQGIAAKIFCQFLVEQGLIDSSTLPAPLDGVSQTSLVSCFLIVVSPSPHNLYAGFV